MIFFFFFSELAGWDPAEVWCWLVGILSFLLPFQRRILTDLQPISFSFMDLQFYAAWRKTSNWFKILKSEDVGLGHAPCSLCYQFSFLSTNLLRRHTHSQEWKILLSFFLTCQALNVNCSHMKSSYYMEQQQQKITFL